MSFSTSSPNMNLSIPSVGLEPGPQWAADINASLTIVDQHDHSPGYGVPVPPSGININSDLSFNNNNLIQARSLRMFPQVLTLSAVNDIGCLYVTGVDLYYNDVSGNQIRITASGGITGTPGSIGGLTAPASATYVPFSSTFVWQSNVNTPANMDFASAILRNLTVSSFGLTLNPPTAMAADFSITLPTLPASQKIVTLDNSGNMGAALDVDNNTLGIVSNLLQVNNNSIGNSQLQSGAAIANIAPGTIAPEQLSASNFLQGSPSGLQSTILLNVYNNIPNQTATLTTHGRPTIIGIKTAAGGTTAFMYVTAGTIGGLQLTRDGTPIFTWRYDNSSGVHDVPIGPVSTVDLTSASSHTYNWQFARLGGANVSTMFVQDIITYAYELY